LLTFPGVTPACKGSRYHFAHRDRLCTLWKITAHYLQPLKFICIFKLFIKLPGCVQCMLVQGTHIV
jgi:hypothetical protein